MKKVLVLMLSLCLIAVIFACKKGDTKGDSTGGQVDISVAQKVPTGGKFVVSPQLVGWDNAEIELTWQPVPAHSMSDPSPARSGDLMKKAEAWVKKYPNVKIIPVGTTQNINDSMTKLRVTAVEGGAPDVSAVDSFMMPLFKEYARDIDDVAAEYGINLDDYFPYIKSQVTENGHIRALWYTTDVRGLFYRKDLISNAPATVDEMLTTAQEMKAKGLTGLLYLGRRNEGTVNNLWGLYWSQGAKLTDAQGNLAFDKGTDREAMLNLLNFIKKTIDLGVTPKTIIDYGSDIDMYGEVAAGNVAMFIAPNQAIAQCREIMGKDKFDAVWEFAPLPVFEAGQKSTSSAGGWTSMVFARDELHRRLAADLIINLYCTDAASESWTLAGGWLPTRQSNFTNFSYIKDDHYLSQMRTFLDAASTRPAVEVYNIISMEIQVAIGNVVTGTSSPEQALETAIRNIKNNQ
ncbi:ABC transporter substrate-binding protein [Spirochaetia bacterium]|nr:ABC transporter substrate-binding protein [Spirochaetia bacterium]